MTKHDIIKAAAIATGNTQETTAAILSAALDAATDALIRGDKITMRGFGTLETRQRKGRTARNYITGADVIVAPRVTAAFVPAQALKDKLNGGQ